MNAKTKAAVIAHGKQLLKIFPHAIERDPIKLCKRLRRLERAGQALALRLCNGPDYADGEAARIGDAIMDKAEALLRFKKSRVGVSLHADPRGYALKIEADWMFAHPKARLHHDWGGYGIIAPDLTESV
jgi:predicted HAD superfamily phosphohydrolase